MIFFSNNDLNKNKFDLPRGLVDHYYDEIDVVHLIVLVWDAVQLIDCSGVVAYDVKMIRAVHRGLTLNILDHDSARE
jgi:hypothetical protein